MGFIESSAFNAFVVVNPILDSKTAADSSLRGTVKPFIGVTLVLAHSKHASKSP